jgi:hypothetical protein
MVWAAPSFNGLVLLSGLLWFSVKWAEVSIGLVRFGFSFTMGWFVMGISLCTWSLWAGCFSQHFSASWTAFRAARTAVLEQLGQQHLDCF